MCYDVSFTVDMRALEDYFPGLIFDSQLEINFDPTHIMGHSYFEHPIVYADQKDGILHARMMEWGVIPFYVKDIDEFKKKQRATYLNIRAERVLDDAKSYWNKIRNRRCLVPLTGIYEHRKIKGWQKKVPYFVQLNDQGTFFLPGLYSAVEIVDKETGEVQKHYTYALITIAANSLMKMIHNDGENKWRMPLFLPFELAKKWVQKDLPDESYREILSYQLPAESLNAYPVWSIRTPKIRPDGKCSNEYFEWDKLPVLEMDQL